MKIIISRKGFDSTYGGMPSIILPNNDMITFPIPCDEDFYTYDDVCFNGVKLYDYLINFKKTINNNGIKPLTHNIHCHLDPDLYDASVERIKGFRGCFGQTEAAQGVLNHNNVKEGDIFIFFGWYKKTYNKGHKLVLEKGNGKHVLFGYLQIDKIIHPKIDGYPEWLENHPHIKNKERYYSKNNTIYIAKDVCTFDENIKGYGLFNYSKDLDLSIEGMNKSCWRLPECFKGLKITYHNENNWHDNYFKAASRGQEFVVEENKEVEKWAIALIKKHSNNKL